MERLAVTLALLALAGLAVYIHMTELRLGDLEDDVYKLKHPPAHNSSPKKPAKQASDGS